MKQSKQSKIRAKLIESFEDQKARRIATLQRAFRLSISSYLLSELSTKGDAIKPNARNFSVLAGLGSLQNLFYADNILPFLRWTSRSANKLYLANEKYFNSPPKGLRDTIKTKLANRLGVSGSAIRPGGLLSTIGDISKPFNDIKALASRTVASGAELKELKTSVKVYNSTNPVIKDMSEKSEDLFPIIDRDVANDFRQGLGLHYAIYQGGIIKTSRPFCIERNNNVYTIEEIASWRNLEFQGKSNPYDPFTDCGGYNCRHQLDWISDELAFILRPDLKNSTT